MTVGINVETEQPAMDQAYEAGEERLARLSETLERGIEASTNKAADGVATSYRNEVKDLERALQDRSLIIKGRVDFAPDTLDGETYYITIARLGVLASPQTIVWESEQARAFHDPRGWSGGHVQRKVTIDGIDRIVKAVKVVDLLEPVDEHGDLPEDRALLELLDERRGSELTEVVATIRRDQFGLMELPADENLVVQGGPGTGKTIVGLHRVSVLLYRTGLEADEILVVTPTDTLARYVQHVLPSLGRASVLVTPMSGLGRHGAGQPVAEAGDAAAARQSEAIKGRAELYEVLARDVRSLPRTPDDLAFRGRSVSRAQILQLISRTRATSNSYSVLRRRIQEELSTRLDPEGTATRTDLQPVLDRVVPDRSPRQLVAELLSSRTRLERAAEGLLTPGEQGAIQRDRVNVADVPWTLADLPLLDAADDLLNGRLPSDQRYRHIVIDEAQDLSPMQLRMLRRRLDDDGAFTILGDLAQATKGWATESWSAHLEAGGIAVAAENLRELATGYRVPSEQLEYANRLLPVMDIRSEPPTSILRREAHPELFQCTGEDQLEEAGLAVRIALDERAEGETVAVIGPAAELDELHEHLTSMGIACRWMDTDTHAVTLVTPEEAKGLEFDHVIVHRPELIYRSDATTGPRMLYVALTRARRSLSLVHVDPLPSALSGLPQVDAPLAKPAAGRSASAVTTEDSETASTVDGVSPTEIDGSTPTPNATMGAAGQYLVVADAGSRLVAWQQGQVRVDRFDDEGGEGKREAEGQLAAGPNGTAVLLRTASGLVTSLVIPIGQPDEFANSILAAVDELDQDLGTDPTDGPAS